MRPLKEETKRWLARAAEDLADAQLLLDEGRFNAASFHAQQAAEKSLKALLVERQGRFSRVHNLVSLALEAKAPPEMLPHCRLLTPAYTAARYPDAGGDVGSPDAEALQQAAREVTAWVRRQIS